MAVQTSSITTAANGNLTITPNGAGQVRVSTLTGSNNQPVGVDNNGELYQFNIADLAAGTPAGTDILMMEIGGSQEKVTAQQLVDVTDSISLTDLSVTTAATGTATGGLAYNNTTGVFTFTPIAGGTGGISLTDLSVTTAAAGTATGGLAYDNTTGVFTFTPVSGLVAATAAEAAAGTLNTVYLSPATGVPKDAAGMTGALLSPGGTTAQRPATAVAGMVRFNSDTGEMEFYGGTSWSTIGGGGGLGSVSRFTASTSTITHGLNVPTTNQLITFWGGSTTTAGTTTYYSWRAGPTITIGANQRGSFTTPAISITTTSAQFPVTVASNAYGVRWVFNTP